VEYRISVDPIAIDALAESAWRSDARRRTPFPAHPHLGAVRIARTIPDLVDDVRFGRRQAACDIDRSAGLTANRSVGVVFARPGFLDHAVDDAVEPVARSARPCIDILELERGDSVGPKLLVRDIVAPPGGESPAIPMNGRRQGHDAVERLAISLGHFMTFATTIRAADVVIPIVLPA